MESVDYIESELRNTQNFETQKQIKKEKFKIVNQVGLIYAIGIAILSQIGQIYSKIFRNLFPNFVKHYSEDSTLLATLIVNHILGTPLMIILTKFIKKTEIQKQSYGYKKYLANLCINIGLLIFGTLIGYLLQFSFISIFQGDAKETQYELSNLSSFKNSNIFLNFFVTCFTAPIAEELVFRKLLIDRLSVFNKTLAIFASGIIFGISHINIHQFFGTLLLGWSLAYSYVETGNILIPISYHMFENSITTITQIFNPYQPNKKEVTIREKMIIVLLSMRLIEGLTGIILLLIYRKKIKVRGEENRSKDKWKLFKSYGMWIFIFEGFILFSIFYMNVFF